MTKKNIIFLGALCVCVLVLLLLAGIIYRTDYAKTEVMTSESPDGEYRLIIYMIGEPDFPFGSAHCLLDLFHGGEKLAEQSLSVLNDGAAVHDDNFNILWNENDVTVIVSGSEQENMVYVLGYDGPTTNLVFIELKKVRK